MGCRVVGGAATALRSISPPVLPRAASTSSGLLVRLSSANVMNPTARHEHGPPSIADSRWQPRHEHGPPEGSSGCREAVGPLLLAVGVGCAQNGPATAARSGGTADDCSEQEEEGAPAPKPGRVPAAGNGVLYGMTRVRSAIPMTCNLSRRCEASGASCTIHPRSPGRMRCSGNGPPTLARGADPQAGPTTHLESDCS